MTTAFAIGVLVVAAGCGLAFLWWLFSGAAAWIDGDADRPDHLDHTPHDRDADRADREGPDE